jgi:hypothetical protein
MPPYRCMKAKRLRLGGGMLAKKLRNSRLYSFRMMIYLPDCLFDFQNRPWKCYFREDPFMCFSLADGQASPPSTLYEI